MNRGIVRLTKEEITEILKYTSNEKLMLSELKDENDIFLNEEEIENILDDLGNSNENQDLLSSREKLSKALLLFRGKSPHTS